MILLHYAIACFPTSRWGNGGSLFFVLSWPDLMFQLAGIWSCVPWPTRDVNGGGHGVQRCLRGLHVLVACYQSAALASARWLNRRLGSGPPRGHSSVNAREFTAHLADFEYGAFAPFRKGGFTGSWVVWVSSHVTSMCQHHRHR